MEISGENDGGDFDNGCKIWRRISKSRLGRAVSRFKEWCSDTVFTWWLIIPILLAVFLELYVLVPDYWYVIEKIVYYTSIILILLYRAVVFLYLPSTFLYILIVMFRYVQELKYNNRL